MCNSGLPYLSKNRIVCIFSHLNVRSPSQFLDNLCFGTEPITKAFKVSGNNKILCNQTPEVMNFRYRGICGCVKFWFIPDIKTPSRLENIYRSRLDDVAAWPLLHRRSPIKRNPCKRRTSRISRTPACPACPARSLAAAYNICSKISSF